MHAMLGAGQLEVDVVVPQVPQIVWADPETTTRADWKLASLDATCELSSPATVGRPVHRALASVLHSPLPFELGVHHRRRFALLRWISLDHDLSLLIGGKRGGVWVERPRSA